MEKDKTLFIPSISDIIDNALNEFNAFDKSAPTSNTIPSSDKISKEGSWTRINKAICVYIDMKGSTQLSIDTETYFTAKAYQLFSDTAVRILDSFNAQHIDVKGDGVFGMFNQSDTYKAFASAMSFKTFFTKYFIDLIKIRLQHDIGLHIGIDQANVLVKNVGMRKTPTRDDRQNVVWAGEPVNIASKLASLTNENEVLVSKRYFDNLKNPLVLQSCGCNDNGQKKPLWKERDLSNNDKNIKFPFDKGYYWPTNWCETHGKDYCTRIIQLDDNK